jgi:hypothetical protein
VLEWLAAEVARPNESPFLLLARDGPTTPTRAVLPGATSARPTVIVLTSCQSNPRFLWSRLRNRWRIDLLACFGGHQSNGPFSYYLEAVSSRSHKVLLSLVKKFRQEIYGKSDWPLTGLFIIWEGPPATNNQTLRPIRNDTATPAAHGLVSLSSISIITSLRDSV